MSGFTPPTVNFYGLRNGAGATLLRNFEVHVSDRLVGPLLCMETQQAINAAPETAPWSADLIDMYATHFDRLVSVATSTVRDRMLAEECVQDAFLAYHAKGVQPRKGAELSYLRTMVRNAAVSRVRSEVRERNMYGAESEPCPSAEDLAVAQIAAEELVSQVDQLPAQQGTVVRLRLAGMSVNESATTMAVATGTVKTHRHRAARAVRETYGGLLAA